MRSLATSISQIASAAAARRAPAAASGVTTVASIIALALGGRHDAAALLAVALFFLMVGLVWAYHDLRLERDALRAQVATEASERSVRLWATAHQMHDEIGRNLRRIEQATSDGRWWPGHDPLPAFAWTSGETTLLELGAQDAGVHAAFGAAKRAYDLFHALNTMLAPGITHVLPPGVVSDAELPAATMEAGRTARTALVAVVPALQPQP